MKIILTFLAGIVIAVGGYFYPSKTTESSPTLGAYNVTGGGTYRLQSSVSGTASSITLTSFKEPISNIPYTMSYLNSSIEYATIEPQSSSREFISFTGINQNSDGTATLTGVSRGLSPSYPFTASTTFQQSHSGQTILILSNPPQLYNQFYNLSNVSTSTNILNFSSTTPPRYDNVAAQGTGTYIATTSELASVAYVNAVALTSAPNGTESVKGVWQGATQIQMASSTILGGTGAGLVMQSRYATSSPGYAGLWSVVTNNAGKIAQSFMDFAQTTTWTALHTFSAGLLSTASSTFSATTTISASDVNSNALRLNGLAYAFPSTRAASTTALMEDGSGNLRFLPNFSRQLFLQTSPVTNGAGTTTLFSAVVPANTLGANGVIQCTIPFSTFTVGSDSATGYFAFAYGTGTTTDLFTQGASAVSGARGTMTLILSGAGATNSQRISFTGSFARNVANNTFQAVGVGKAATIAVDSTAARMLMFDVARASGTDSFTADQVICEIIR